MKIYNYELNKGGTALAERFKFGLEKLLEMRKSKEEESKRLFTECQREKRKIEEKLEQLNNDFHKYNGISPNEDVIYQKLKKILHSRSTKWNKVN